MRFPPDSHALLKFYVYAYIDPRDGHVFYIGKGQGDRCFDHLFDTSETAKVQRIADIHAAGLHPRIEILVHGIDNEIEAFRIEAVCIDLIGMNHLTNLVTGQRDAWGGRQPVEQLIDDLTAEPADLAHPALAFIINQTFAYGTPPEALYEATRGVWRISRERASAARFAFAVYRGIIKEVYTIHAWHPAGTTPYTMRTFEPGDFDGRSEFIGTIAPNDVRSRYLGRRLVLPPSQTPFRYLGC